MKKQVWVKKDASVQLRMPSELKEELTEVATQYNDTASGLARFLVERFLLSHKSNNSTLIYPPEFKTHSTSNVST